MQIEPVDGCHEENHAGSHESVPHKKAPTGFSFPVNGFGGYLPTPPRAPEGRPAPARGRVSGRG